MASPNDVQLTDAFVRLVGGAISEEAIADSLPSEIVVEVEAGSTVFGTLQPAFNILAVVTDKMTGAVVQTSQATGRVGLPPWNIQATAIPLAPAIPPQTPAKDNHLYEVSVAMSVGAGNPEVLFADDIKFVITAP